MNESVDIANLFWYIEYMAALARWQQGLGPKPKYKRLPYGTV